MLSENSRDETAFMQQAMDCHRQGKLKKAASLYKKVLKLNAQRDDCWNLYAMATAQQGYLDDSLALINKAIALKANPAYLVNKGNIYKQLKQYESAKQAYQQAIQQQPQYPEALNNLAICHYHLSEYELAEKYYQQALILRPDYFDCHYNLALLYLKSAQFSLAKNHLQHVLLCQSNHVMANYYWADACYHLNEMTEAITHFKKVIELAPQHPTASLQLAQCYLRIGHYPTAKQYFQEAIQVVSDDNKFHAYFNLGFIAGHEHELEQALHYYQQALELSPDNAEILQNIGVIYYKQGNIEQAKKYYRYSLQRNPNNKSVTFMLDCLEGKFNYQTVPTEYVKNLFNGYAHSFEKHLLEQLNYQVPQTIFQQTMRFLSNPNNLAILDLGCGTGLAGNYFYPYANRLVGVDISAAMLNKASDKKIYSKLQEQEIHSYLATTEEKFDLIIAADVFSYLGQLDDIFSHCYHRLNEQGIFSFTVEAQEQLGYSLQSCGRFQHNKNYLIALAEKQNFIILHSQELVLRQQQHQPVDGFLFVLKKGLS